LPSSSLTWILSEKGESKSPVYNFISDALLRDDPADNGVKLSLLKLRVLSRQQHYAEALELAEQTTQLARVDSATAACSASWADWAKGRQFSIARGKTFPPTRRPSLPPPRLRVR
jgi:hypothetical protein